MKNFILDTNVLLYDPNALFKFAENDIILPIVVLSELDKFKSEPGELGHNSRAVARILDELRQKGDLKDGVSLGEGMGVLRVFAENMTFEFRGLKETNDLQIIGCCKELAFPGPGHGHQVVLVTKDMYMRAIADSLGVTAQDYRSDEAESCDIGKVRPAFVDVGCINKLYELRKLPWDELDPVQKTMPMENDGLILTSFDEKSSALARFKGGNLHLVNGERKELFSIYPRNAEQRLLANVLMDESIDLVVCAGAAGSGKTLLSLAAGFEHALLHKKHRGHSLDRVLITKSIEAVGNDIGFLPGSKDEKMAEWLKPFHDNMELLMRGRSESLQQLQDRGAVETDALTYIRGRSLMNRFVIVDECQNLAPRIIKTIVSRIADGSKLVLLGDLQQIDTPYLSARNNGLAYAMSKLRGEPSVAILNLEKSERSSLAKIAIQRL